MKGKIEINMPKDVSYIIDTLNNRGFKAYIVEAAYGMPF